MDQRINRTIHHGQPGINKQPFPNGGSASNFEKNFKGGLQHLSYAASRALSAGAYSDANSAIHESLRCPLSKFFVDWQSGKFK